MKKIRLSNTNRCKNNGKHIALVDDEFAYISKLNGWNWTASKQSNNRIYAFKNIKTENGHRQQIKMHRLILNTPKGMYIDHIDGNTLNNQSSNLRIATNHQNQANRPKTINNTSGYKGVYWHKQNKKWKAQIKFKGKDKHLGYFKNKEDASMAYNIAAKELFGEFAFIN